MLSRDEVVLDDRLRHLVEDDDGDAERAGPAPGAGAVAAHPAISATTMPRSTKSTMIPIIGLRSSAKPPPPTERRDHSPEEVEVGVGRLGDEVEDDAQPAVVGHARDPGDEDVEEDQDDVDEEQGVDVVGDVAAGQGERDHPRILSSEARTAASNASRAAFAVERLQPRLGAAAGRGDRPAHVGRMPPAEQLGGPGGRLDDQLASELLVEPGLGAGIGERLDGKRRDRRARIPSPRWRRRTPSRAARPVAQRLQHRPDLGARASRRHRGRPAAPRLPTLGITRTTSRLGKAPLRRSPARWRRAARRSPSRRRARPRTSPSIAGFTASTTTSAALGQLTIRPDGLPVEPPRPAPRPVRSRNR